MVLTRGFFGEWTSGEVAAGVSQLVAGAVSAFLLYRFVRATPWPRPFRIRFAALHLLVAIAFGVGFIALTIALESLFTGSLQSTRTAQRAVELPSELPSSALLLYAVVIGVAYSVERRARHARIEAEAVRAQLAALRAQLHPHFLFNALHAVVQLIPIDQGRAIEAAELVASLLRAAVEENRDEVPLDDEWAFVSRYLEVEQIRFGDRLRVRAKVDPELLDERVPSFGLQTLVENAVHHGAALRIAPTEIVVTAVGTESELTLTVWNDGDRSARAAATVVGTGLSRLRERLHFLYGDAARLTSAPREQGGFEASLTVPRRGGS